MSRFCIFDVSLLDHKALMFLLVTFQTIWLQTLCWALHGRIFIICPWRNCTFQYFIVSCIFLFSLYIWNFTFYKYKEERERLLPKCRIQFLCIFTNQSSWALLLPCCGHFITCLYDMTTITFLINTELPSCLPWQKRIQTVILTLKSFAVIENRCVCVMCHVSLWDSRPCVFLVFLYMV